jgi:hypothetical protein
VRQDVRSASVVEWRRLRAALADTRLALAAAVARMESAKGMESERVLETVVHRGKCMLKPFGNSNPTQSRSIKKPGGEK